MMKSTLMTATTVIAVISLIIGPGECSDGDRKKRQATTINCVPMVMPMNGLLNYSPQPLGPYTSGSTVSLQCNLGFTPTQPTTATCQSGLWTPATLGMCMSSTGSLGGLGGVTTYPGQTLGGIGGIGTQCIPMPVASGGYITYSTIPTTNTLGQQVYNTGTTGTLNCNLGTSVIGSQTSTCQSGMWSPSFGYCSGMTGIGGMGIGGMGIGTTGSGQCTLSMTPPFGGGTITYSQGGPPYNQGSIATLICPSGTPLIGGSNTATCTCMGTLCSWQPPAFITPCSTTGVTTGFGNPYGGIGGIGVTSTIGQCSVAPTGGTITYTLNGQPAVNVFGPWQQGTTATLQCFGGSAMGTSTASCMNGIWTPTSILGPCSTGGLGGLTSGFGSTLYPGVTSYGTTCAFAPIGMFGTISYSGCNPPPCNVTGPWPQGVTATLTCNAGSMLTSGSTTSTCQGGTFTPPMGVCSSSTLGTGLGGMPFGTGTTGSTGTGACQVITVANGVATTFPDTTYPYDLNTAATLICNPGYTAAGPTSATCLSSGWSVFPLGPCNQAIG